MMRLEARYGDLVNFVTVNGDDPRNAKLVSLFGVDGVPHLSLIDGDRKIKGTLIGEVPEGVVESCLSALAKGQPLPYGGDGG